MNLTIKELEIISYCLKPEEMVIRKKINMEINRLNEYEEYKRKRVLTGFRELDNPNIP